MTPSGRLRLGKSPAESAKEREREQRRPGREAGGLGEEGEKTRFHSLGKGDRISGSAGGDQRRPEAPDSDYLYLEIIFKNIFYPRSIFFFLKLTPVMLIISLKKNRGLPPWLSFLEHRSKPGLKKFPLEKLQIILNY